MRQAGTYSGLLSKMSGRAGTHSLPLARIKKIMKKSGDDVKMISGEAPIVFSKACELFIEELTKRSWTMTMQGKRRTLLKDDVASAVIATDIFDFLLTLVSESGNNINADAGQVNPPNNFTPLSFSPSLVFFCYFFMSPPLPFIPYIMRFSKPISLFYNKSTLDPSPN